MMTLTLPHWSRLATKINPLVEGLLYRLSVYAVPLLIGVVSVISLLYWPSVYSAHGGNNLPLRVAQDPSGQWDAPAAWQALGSVPATPYMDTKLSEQPFWVHVAVPPADPQHPVSLLFVSRHASTLSCWGGPALARMGSGNRAAQDGVISLSKAGFAVAIPPSGAALDVVCRTASVGPGRIAVALWNTVDLQHSDLEFHRRAGLLDGGMMVLCIFVLLTAAINRSGLYLLFSAWLAVSLRMAELSYGWDVQWIGNTVPIELISYFRSITIAIYYTITITLFGALFKDDFETLCSMKMLRFAQWTCLPVLVFSALLEYKKYLPVLWTCTVLNIVVLTYYLIKILVKTRSRVAIWYSVGLAITLFSSFSEVVAASFGLKLIIGSVNSVTAALASSLLTALAIAEHIREEHKARMKVQAELARTFNAMPIGMFTLDLEGNFLNANPALLAMLGDDVVSAQAHWSEFFEAGAWPQLQAYLEELADAADAAARPVPEARVVASLWLNSALVTQATQTAPEFEISGVLQSDEVQPKRYLVKATLTKDKVQGSLQDITEKARATAELLFLANHDSLTKVLNRRGLENVLSAALNDLPLGRTMCMAYLDLDRFKLINDMYGHAVGDEVLQQVCGRVNALLPPGMSIGRVGGDEFVIVLPETPLTMAEHVCRGIIEAITTQACHVSGNTLYVYASIGLIELDADMSLKDALSGADRACQQAKLANRGGLMTYHKDTPQFKEYEAQLVLMTQLVSGTPNAGLYLEMQPLMSLSDPCASLDFEVLLRMRNPDGSVVPTDRLIGAAQASGRIVSIDMWVVRSTVSWLSMHHKALAHTHFVCINLNGASLNDAKFLSDICEVLENNRDIVHMVCLEITESVALNDIENTRRFVSKVRRIGARVALDDFGAGYTSFTYLKEISADILKIDGSFIVDMNKHPANIAIVETIVSLAKNMGMKVIAEWVENHATLQTLTEIGVDYAQGFIISKALPPQAILGAASAYEFLTPPEPLNLTHLNLPHLIRPAPITFVQPPRTSAP